MAAPRPVYHSLSALRHKDPGDGAAGLGSTIACCPQPCGVPRTAVLKPGSAAAVPSLRGLEDAKRVEWAGVSEALFKHMGRAVAGGSLGKEGNLVGSQRLWLQQL